MKKALKCVKLNILGIALGLVGVGIPLLVYGISVIPSLNANPFPYPYLEWPICFLYVLLGFVISDVQIARYRHKDKNWGDKLPEEIKNKAWSIRYPFYLAAVIVFIFCLFCEIFYLITGSYPFPFTL